MRKRYNTPHRSRVVKTRMTEEEYAEFAERLSACNMSQSEFIRQAITGAAIRPIITVSPVNDELLAAVGKLTAEYGRIGGNLNQIARYVLYGDIQKEEQGLKEAHKKASRRKTLMEQELKNLKGEKMRMYEEYAAGTLLLDTYKQKKQECDRRISEVQEQIEQSKVEESTKSVVPGTVRAAAEQAENFLNGTRLTASMVSAFIENVFVYDGGRIVVRFKYEQSIQDAVKALHTG